MLSITRGYCWHHSASLVIPNSYCRDGSHTTIKDSDILYSLRTIKRRDETAITVGNPFVQFYLDRVKRIWYLSAMRAAKVQASLRIRAVSPEPPLLAHTSSESRGTFRQKARFLAPLNGWACAVKICHDGMLEDTNSLDGAHLVWCFTAQPILSKRRLRYSWRVVMFYSPANTIKEAIKVFLTCSDVLQPSQYYQRGD